MYNNVIKSLKDATIEAIGIRKRGVNNKIVYNRNSKIG